MINFNSDYINGAHPKVLQKLIDTNNEYLSGYGTDRYSYEASEKIKRVFNCPDAYVYFLTGGTQTNQIIIETMLKSYEGVICAKSGHINVHEAGAIEYSGHKCLALDSKDGKISATQVQEYINSFYKESSYDHMVFPGMVYISFPTEYGTLYSYQELRELHNVCINNNIPLFIDGARLGYGLASLNNNIPIDEFANLCDIFYIGGTKQGALCGEAVVFSNANKAPKHFNTLVKQRGAMVAKGRLISVQFDALFTDNLYIELSKHAISKSNDLKHMFMYKGYKLYLDSPTNQQFIIMRNDKIKELEQNVVFSIWEPYDSNYSVVRFVTSWSTTSEDLIKLNELL